MKNRLRQSLVMGLICAPVGFVVGYVLLSDAPGDGLKHFQYYAAVAAFLAPTLAWWLLVERKSRLTLGRGIGAGALGAAVAHYVCWYLMIVGSNIDYWLLQGPGSSLGEAPIDVINGLWGAAGYALLSYLVIGWATLPAGALIGLAYYYFLMKRSAANT